MSASPSLSALVSAVRAHAPLAGWVASLSPVSAVGAPPVEPAIAEAVRDAAIAEVVRTARTTKGAIWLATRAATRAAGPQDDPTKQDGQAQTAEACLRKLAAAGHAGAAAALAAWTTVVLAEELALADDLEQEVAAQV